MSEGGREVSESSSLIELSVTSSWIGDSSGEEEAGSVSVSERSPSIGPGSVIFVIV